MTSVLVGLGAAGIVAALSLIIYGGEKLQPTMGRAFAIVEQHLRRVIRPRLSSATRRTKES